MDDADISTAIDDIVETICDHDAYRPSQATPQQSLEYLQGVRSGVDSLIEAIETELS